MLETGRVPVLWGSRRETVARAFSDERDERDESDERDEAERETAERRAALGAVGIVFGAVRTGSFTLEQNDLQKRESNCQTRGAVFTGATNR